MPPDELLQPKSLKTTIYVRALKEFMDSKSEVKSHQNFVSYLSSYGRKKKIDLAYDLVFDGLKPETREYLQLLFRGGV